MLWNEVRLLVIGYSKGDADVLCAELSRGVHNLTYNSIELLADLKAVLHTSSWDIIISNHVIPSFNSMNALSIIKENDEDTPFIIYSKNLDEEIAISAIRNGANDCLYKKNTARLILSIERELKNAATRRAKLQADDHIYRLAYYDELTGLPKRRLFCEKVLEILSEKNEEVVTAAIYFIDLERLSRINTTYGYSVGDILIQQLSFRLSAFVNSDCLLTRIESGKFAYFNCNFEDSSDIQMFANRILRLASTPFVINNLEFYVTFNIGICTYPKECKDISTLLANAESAMSFNNGYWRNNCSYYVNAADEASMGRLKLERSLRKVIENRELILHYQPIVDLKTGCITGAEALVRWNHPEFGVLLPDKFIPLADETGFIVEIGRWVLRQACTQAKLWHDAGYDSMSISVNISAIELDQSQLLSHVLRVLEETGLYPGALELEITESVLMQDAETSIRTLQELKKIGVKIAVDDFGTGYSSLSYLKRLPIDILKIDRSFARDIVTDSDSSAIVAVIIALARSLGLSALAEGVETKEQFDFLCDEKCDRAQGYLFSKPVDAERLLLLLAQRKTGTLA